MNSEDKKKIVEDLTAAVLQFVPKLIEYKAKTAVDEEQTRRFVQLNMYRKEASDAWVQFASAALASGQFALGDNVEGSSEEAAALDVTVSCAEIADGMLSEWKSRFPGPSEDDEDFDDDAGDGLG